MLSNYLKIAFRNLAKNKVLAVGVAFLTVSYQSIKAAIVNPVKSLRSE